MTLQHILGLIRHHAQPSTVIGFYVDEERITFRAIVRTETHRHERQHSWTWDAWPCLVPGAVVPVCAGIVGDVEDAART